jgi:HD superfamily phosphohydrolase
LQYKGRPKEKAFLYDIVNNAVHGVDVDKAEYMLRDAMYLSASIPFTKVLIGSNWGLYRPV